MRSAKKPIASALFASCIMVACDDPKAASNANFEKALQSYYDAHPVCISLADTLPIDIGPSKFEPMRPQMEALTKVGLLSATKVQKSESTLSGTSPPATYTRYSVAPSGEQAVHAGANKFFGGTDICFAHRKITKIETFTEPADAMGVKVSQVTYDYTLTDIASWTKDVAVHSAFPGIAGTLAKPDGRQTEALDQKNAGWRLERDVQ